MNFPVINLGSAALDLAQTVTSIIANIEYILTGSA